MNVAGAEQLYYAPGNTNMELFSCFRGCDDAQQLGLLVSNWPSLLATSRTTCRGDFVSSAGGNVVGMVCDKHQTFVCVQFVVVI
jgi:hypothetical protein